MEVLMDKYKSYPVIYTREPHAKEGIFKKVDQPTEYYQREEYAKQTREELKIRREILINNMDGKVQDIYGRLPNMIYIIDPEGTIAYHDRWANAKDIDCFLEKRLGE